MATPSKVAAIYVPVDLEHDVEEFLRQKYHLKLLNTSPTQRTESVVDVGVDGRMRMAVKGDEKPARPTSRSKTPQGRGRGDSDAVQAGRRTPVRRVDPEVWTRLSTPHRRAAEEQAAPKPRSTPRRQSQGYQGIHERLYEAGISQQERHERAAEEARRRRVEAEEAEMRRGKTLMAVLSNSDNYGLRGAAFEQKMAEAVDGKRFKEADIQELTSRLSRTTPKPSRPVGREDRELTFHPRTSEPTKASRAELDEHFNHLYLDARKKLRSRRELLDKYRDKERRIAFERRLRDDPAFRRRVEEDPSVGERYMRSLQI